MFAWMFIKRVSTREVLISLNNRMYLMALDLSKLNAAVERSVKASEALLAAHTDPAAQGAINAATAALEAVAVKTEAAVVSPAA